MVIEFDDKGAPVEPVVPAVPSPAEPAVKQPQVGVEPTPPAVAKKPDNGGIEPTVPAVPGDVPYSRFKEVNDAKKLSDDRALKAETLLQEREAEINGLRQPPATEPQQSFQDELFVNGEKVIGSLVDGKLQSQQERLNSLELKDATTTINDKYKKNDVMQLQWKTSNDLHKAIGETLGKAGLLKRNSDGKIDISPDLYSQGYTMLMENSMSKLTDLAKEAGRKAQLANETLIDGQGPTGGGTGGPPTKEPWKVALTEQELKHCKVMGKTEEQHQKSKYFHDTGTKPWEVKK